jgi:hypothetical protein
MFIEMFSQDVRLWGDGEKDEVTIDMAGWPFNINFGHQQYPDKVAAMVVEGETLTQVECTSSGSYVTIKFPTVKSGGESWTVRLRAKFFV